MLGAGIFTAPSPPPISSAQMTSCVAMKTRQALVLGLEAYTSPKRGGSLLRSTFYSSGPSSNKQTKNAICSLCETGKSLVELGVDSTPHPFRVKAQIFS